MTTQCTETATLQFTPSRPGEPARGPQLFCVLECGCPARPVSRHALDGLDEIRLGRAAQRRAERCQRDIERKQLTIAIADRWLSSEHAEISRQGERFVLRDLGSKNGSRINGAPVETAALEDGDIIELGQSFLVFRAHALLPDTAPHDFVISADQVVAGLGTLHAQLSAQFSDLGRIAATDVPVAILGETGTGKELIARAVHDMSRRAGEFIAVNCGAIPADLASSELFGHAKGAFTGATADKLGFIRSADRGTLFLDEFGELPAEQQVVLLRVLQERAVVPLGTSTPRKVDFRLVVATNRDISGALASRQFREDLWARASGFVVRLPPLRERREDLGLILGSLLVHHGSPGERVVIRSDAAHALLRYHWPQNIRELEQCLRSALALRQDDAIVLANLPDSLRGPSPAGDAAGDDAADAAGEANNDAGSDEDPAEALDEHRQAHLRKLLERTSGNLSEVARLMGKGRTQIQRWIKRYGIDPGRYRHP